MTDQTHLPYRVDAPLLRTERLDLWLPQPGDWLAVHRIVSDGETGRYLGPMQSEAEGFGRFMRSSGSWFIYGYGMFLIRARGQSEIIGTCGMFHMWRGIGEDMDDIVEAGWIIAADQTGKGYATEGMRAALDWFDREFGGPVMCMIDPDNVASLRIADKLGFQPVRQSDFDGERVDLFKRPAG